MRTIERHLERFKHWAIFKRSIRPLKIYPFCLSYAPPPLIEAYENTCDLPNYLNVRINRFGELFNWVLKYVLLRKFLQAIMPRHLGQPIEGLSP